MTDFHKLHFNSIQALRGFAAIMVVLEHIRFLSCGAFGVDIFFCISGFMIMYTTHNSTEAFLRKRLLRIVPFYYLMTLGTFILLLLFPSMFEQTKASFAQLIKSLLFIPFDIGGGVIQPLMRIGWTVNCEMFFYLLFAISLHISHKYRGLLCSFMLLTMIGFGALLTNGSTLTTGVTASTSVSSLTAPIIFYGNPVMAEFILGILSYYLLRALCQRTNMSHKLNCKQFGWISLTISLLLFGALIYSTTFLNIAGYRRLLYWGIPAMLIFIGFLIAGFSLTMPRFSVSLGDISFSMYLIHYYPILLLDRKIFDFSTATPISVTGALLGVAGVILLSRLMWSLIEKKFTGWLRAKLIV